MAIKISKYDEPHNPESSDESKPVGGGESVRIYYYGRWYTARIERVVGKGAWVVWRLFGRWAAENNDVRRRRWVSPKRHGAHYRPDGVRRYLEKRGIEYDTVGNLAEDLRDGRRVLKLDDPDFETQALANALDRLAGSWVIDRGSTGPPDINLW